MTTASQYFRAFTRIAILSMVLTLPACQIFAPAHPPVKKVKKLKTAKKTHYQAEAYVKHLALARIAMSNESADYADSAPNLEIMDSYSEQKRSKFDTQAVLVIEYESKNGGGKQVVLAPITISEKAETPGLLAVMNALTLNPSTLHDLRVVTIILDAEPMGELSELGSSQIRQILEKKQLELQATAKAPSLLDNVRTQLSLTRFFMANRFRDAAYLSIDNVEKLLASAASNSPDAEAVKALSQQQEALETELHNTMPFTLTK